MIPLWRESLSLASRETIDLAAESILLHTLSRMKNEAVTHGGTVREMLEITEANFNDPALSIAYLSERLSYHPKYLSHIFKKEMGVGYSEYLRDLRINYARTLLDHGLDSVKNVALLSGFSDPLYFSNVFKKVTGVSPKEYPTAKQ
jgi:two-component system response regulator YesN